MVREDGPEDADQWSLFVKQSKKLSQPQTRSPLLPDEDKATLKSLEVASECSSEARVAINVSTCPQVSQ